MNSMDKVQATSTRPLRYTQQDMFDAFLRTDLCAFIQKVFETVCPGQAFSRNWATEAVAHALQNVVRAKPRD